MTSLVFVIRVSCLREVSGTKDYLNFLLYVFPAGERSARKGFLGFFNVSHACEPTHSSPSAYTSFFQIGTVRFSSLISHSQASNAARR